MANHDIALMAHLMRRAGFGASRDEIEAKLANGYEVTVEELLNPDQKPEPERDLILRAFPAYQDRAALEVDQTEWMYRMVNSQRQLQEKMALFWHSIFCTGQAKVDAGRMMALQIDMFRNGGMGNFRELLVQLSQNPAMVYFLDNCESHKNAVNENYGRELLELFSLGVGMDGAFNYSEDDVKACARAFTGWNLAPTIPIYPYGRAAWEFRYDYTDHDDGEKTFLGQTGRWNGEDIIDIICKRPATARFIARKMYDFFVADEPGVPAWRQTPPRDMEAIKILEKAFFDYDYEVRPLLRTLLNSDFFKSEAVRFAKVKSPAEVVAGTLRLVGEHTDLKHGLHAITLEGKYMAMDLMNPPTVEGWHTGKDWLDSGTLVERINFVADMVGSITLPGVQSIINRLMARGNSLSPDQLVDGCLDLIGPLDVEARTRSELLAHAENGGRLYHSTEVERTDFARRVGEMLQLISATAEYQLA